MTKLPSNSQIVMIQEFVDLYEGFEEVAPECLDASNNPCLYFHLVQYKHHKEAIEKLLQEEFDRLVDEEGG